jgi:hypothetical protein
VTYDVTGTPPVALTDGTADSAGNYAACNVTYKLVTQAGDPSFATDYPGLTDDIVANGLSAVSSYVDAVSYSIKCNTAFPSGYTTAASPSVLVDPFAGSSGLLAPDLLDTTDISAVSWPGDGSMSYTSPGSWAHRFGWPGDLACFDPSVVGSSDLAAVSPSWEQAYVTGAACGSPWQCRVAPGWMSPNMQYGDQCGIQATEVTDPTADLPTGPSTFWTGQATP